MSDRDLDVISTEHAAETGIDTGSLAKRALEMGESGVDALERIIALAERDRDYRARCAYDAAMLLVQSEMPQIFKDGRGDKGSRYPKLENVDRHLRPIYTKHGFRITFTTEPCDVEGWITHVATVSHSGGHVERIPAPFPVDTHGPKGGETKTPLHGVGSAMSYAQRRLTMAAFGAVATGEDDDGRAATQAEPQLVSDHQAAELRALAEDIGLEPAQVFADAQPYLGTLVDSWAAIPAAKYQGMVRAMEARRK